MNEVTDATLQPGKDLMASGQHREAIDWFTNYLGSYPEHPEAYHCLAVNLLKTGQVSHAENILDRSLLIDPEHRASVISLGELYRDKGRHAEAVELYGDYLLARPDDDGVRLLLAGSLHCAGDRQKAVALLVEHPVGKRLARTAGLRLSLLYQELGEYEAAMEQVDRLLAVAPNDGDAVLHRANLCRLTGRYEEALELYSMLATRYPDDPDVKLSLASILAATGDYQQAIHLLDQALESGRNTDTIRYNRGLAKLASGDFESGWEDYESRPSRRKIAASIGIREWRGPGDAVDSLLVVAEQGIGDEVMFASCLPDLRDDADDCTVIIDARLAPVFEQSFDNLRILPKPDSGTLMNIDGIKQYDAFVSMASLPLHYRTDIADFGSGEAFLTVDPDKQRYWHDRLSEFGKGLKLGLSWRGGQNRSIRELRSIPLQDFRDIINMENVVTINLQYGNHASEINQFNSCEGKPVIDFAESDPLSDIEDFLALLKNLDFVISIDNSTVHFAGAIGVETRALLPCYTDWRWMDSKDTTPWYSSVRIIRQDQCFQWQPVLDAVRDDVAIRCRKCHAEH